MVDVHTVGAGGGSIGWRDAGGALRVGPRSAGADPGPACYGRGGDEPTVTDANLLLGRLAADSTLAGGVALDFERGARRGRAGSPSSLGLDELEAAEGIVRVANQEMVRALRVVTVERGIDPRGFALLPFGGAGPMHAAAIAAELGIERILCPRAGGVLSALGLCASDRRRDTARTVMLSGADFSAERVAAEVEELVARCSTDSAACGRRAREPEVVYELRYAGQAFELPVPGTTRPDPADLAARFEDEHERRYGHRDPEGEVVLVHIRLALVAPGPRPRPAAAPAGRLERLPPPGPLRRRVDGDAGPARRAAGRPRRRGPGRLRAARGDLRRPPRLERRGRRHRHDRARCSFPPISDGKGTARRSEMDPVSLQVMIGGLRAACDEMGATLIRSAYSANIKERHDCSTALFDAAGELVMQAEHIPVHLGSMPDAVAAVLDEEQRPGERLDPQRPLPRRHPPARRDPDPPRLRRRRLLGFAACRAHHADIGGPSPAGMPARSRTLEEEGVVIPPTRVERRRARAARRADALAAPAARRPARPSRRQPGRRAAAARAGRAPRGGRAARRDGGDPRLRRAPHPSGAGGTARRHLHGGRRARGARYVLPDNRAKEQHARGRRAAARGADRGRPPDPRLLRHATRRSTATSTARSR